MNAEGRGSARVLQDSSCSQQSKVIVCRPDEATTTAQVLEGVDLGLMQADHQRPAKGIDGCLDVRHLDALGSAQVRFVSGCFRQRDQIAQHATRRGDKSECLSIGQHARLHASTKDAKQKVSTLRVLFDIHGALDVELVEPVDLEAPEALQRSNRSDQHDTDVAAAKRGDILVDQLCKPGSVGRAVERIEQDDELMPGLALDLREARKAIHLCRGDPASGSRRHTRHEDRDGH